MAAASSKFSWFCPWLRSRLCSELLIALSVPSALSAASAACCAAARRSGSLNSGTSAHSRTRTTLTLDAAPVCPTGSATVASLATSSFAAAAAVSASAACASTFCRLASARRSAGDDEARRVELERRCTGGKAEARSA